MGAPRLIPIHEDLVDEEREPFASLIQVVDNGEAKAEVCLLERASRDGGRQRDRSRKPWTHQPKEVALGGLVDDEPPSPRPIAAPLY